MRRRRLRGKPGLRHKPLPLRAQVLARCAKEHCADFGPTLLAEELAKGCLVVDHDTVRPRGQQHRQWRERKPCFGALVQLDGSPHDWFEGRRGKCVLMVIWLGVSDCLLEGALHSESVESL